MPHNRKSSQWDFGELFPRESRQPASDPPGPAAEPARTILSVSELTWELKRVLEQQVGSVWVTGEITNLRAQNSGHIYFTIKDAGSQLSCVLFRGTTVANRSLLRDGQKLLLQGDVTVYEARGQYQLIVRAVEMQGVGALQQVFERLKQQLQAEGLFAPERKRPLPRYPQRIGLVTSPTGAAIRDVLHVIQRRNPGLEIVLAPCRVQGDGAAAEIAAAIRLLNKFSSAGNSNALDLILITRGGGSLEDLWAFNEEAVARAVFESELPVVSAVGHEIDFTISDFVADLRAATPSAAAEIITEGVFSSCAFVADAAARMRQLCRDHLEGMNQALGHLAHRLSRVHPRRRFNDWLQRLDDLTGSLQRCARQALRQQQSDARALFERLMRVRPAQVLRQRREVFELARQRLGEQVRRRVRERQTALAALQDRLRLLGPGSVLSRGYSITLDADSGRVIRDAAGVKKGTRLKTLLHKGEVLSRAESHEAGR